MPVSRGDTIQNVRSSHTLLTVSSHAVARCWRETELSAAFSGETDNNGGTC